MSVDLQIHNQDKLIRHKSNATWDEAHFWLTYTYGRIGEFTKIDIQVFTSEGMPVDDIEARNFDQAHDFLREVLERAKRGGYKGVWC